MLNYLDTRKVQFLTVIISFTFLRYILLFPFGLNLYARFSHLFAFLFLILISTHQFKEKFKNRSKQFNISMTIAALGAMITFLQTLFANYPFYLEVIPNFASTHLALSFIPLILFNLKLNEVLKLLKNLTLVICIVGPLYFYVFYFVIYVLGVPAYKILESLFGENASVLYGNNYILHKENIRQIGFLLIHDRSGAGLAAAFYFQLYFFLEKLKNPLKKIKFIHVFLFFYCAIGIVFSTSLTVTLTSSIVFFILTFYFFKFSIKTFLINVAFNLITITISILNKGVWQRVEIIQKSHEFYKSAFIPGGSGCQLKYLVWRPFTNEAIANLSTPCHFNEIFALWPIVKYGIIPTLPWFLIFVSPLSKIFYIRNLLPHQKAALSLIVTFWICGSHFSGAEFWGNNYLFFLGWIILFFNNQSKELV